MTAKRRSPGKITMPLIKRMRELRDAGLSCAAVAAVIELDHGEKFTTDSVRKYAPRTDTKAFTNLGGYKGMGH